ncbi:MAG: hypothetical protein FWF95_06385, partial [Syntrophorhabdaceae bacterium]|nr:hypothetical protein [Syntrophorhabdaceae bacterium]
MASKLDGIKEIPAKQKILLMVLISAFALVGYYYLFYKDMMADIAILENQLGTLQAKINEHKTITQDLEA